MPRRSENVGKRYQFRKEQRFNSCLIAARSRVGIYATNLTPTSEPLRHLISQVRPVREASEKVRVNREPSRSALATDNFAPPGDISSTEHSTTPNAPGNEIQALAFCDRLGSRDFLPNAAMALSSHR